ncbi:MAG TPA: hypothetical protein VGI67_15805 [Thermoleophilaceae bacterium]|jgi:hypothetical protein
MRVVPLVIAAVGALLFSAPAPAMGAKNCVGAEEAGAHASGGDGGSFNFSSAFYKHIFTLDTSLDGADGDQLPISIEEVCGVPKRLKRQAVQLAGTDGIALLSAATGVRSGSQHLSGAAALTALDGADTAVLRARLTAQKRWGEDEDGNKIPTFTTSVVRITD